MDLFCGVGGLALGVAEAANAVGFQASFRLAVDLDVAALAVFEANFRPLRTLGANASSLVDYQVRGWGHDAVFAYRPEPIHPAAAAVRGLTDVLLAGPPCEGHSNLNNHTRRHDPRNVLLLDAVAFAVAVDAEAVLIENVPEVRRDRLGVVDTGIGLLRSAGYSVTAGVLPGDSLGLPQRRRRFILAASRHGVVPIDIVVHTLRREKTTVRWAIEDLVASDTKKSSGSVMDSPSRLSEENQARIAYLFENGAFDLPNDVRPACHRNGHTYPSVYGRLRWNEPAGTITTGFVSPGRGRFIHPSEPRTLTPHEAARLQTFPDFFTFVLSDDDAPTRAQVTKWIGGAVPPLLGYAAAMSILPMWPQISD